MPPNNQQAPTPDNQQPTADNPAAQAAHANTASEQEKKQARPNTTQNSLLISEIRDDMVIMKDGSFRAVVACQSINFDLMNPREREGIEYSYQNFLNSLYFPAQILIRSQRVDIEPYLNKLVDIRKAEDNMLLNVLIDDYINFVDILAQEANIMDKTFYIVTPFFPLGDLNTIKDQTSGFFEKLTYKNVSKVTKIDKIAFQKAKDEIKNRVDLVSSGLIQMGVRSVQLNTKELGELYYNYYNPDTAVRERLGDFERVTSTYVRKAPDDIAQPTGSQGEVK